MKLHELADGILPIGTENPEISFLTDRCESVTRGSLFVALRGRRTDGHTLLGAAVAAGAVAAVGSEAADLPIPYFRVEDPRSVYARLCVRFFGNDSLSPTLVAVTGTNGKTTTVTALAYLLNACGIRTAYIGSVEMFDGKKTVPSHATTPDPFALNAWIAASRNNGCSVAVAEVSSQGLDQRRCEGLRFSLGVFTNFSEDHLDYHGSMKAYSEAKRRLIPMCDRILINADCAEFSDFRHPDSYRYSLENSVEFSAEDLNADPSGVFYTQRSPSGKRKVFFPFSGRYNGYNSLSALAAAELLGADADFCARSLAGFPGVRGRSEEIPSAAPFRVFCDFAHTPDALKNVLQTLRTITRGRVIAVFGCGGDRDRSKRPEMGKIATELSDFCVITSDNPRTEDPNSILKQIESGVCSDSYRIICNREEAIRFALGFASSGDSVLIAGKGNETEQIFADRTVRFDDREAVKTILKEEGF